MTRGPSPKVDDDDIVATLEDWPKDGKLPSTSNLTEEINEEHGEDYDRKTVYRRLDSLARDDTIAKIEVGMGRGGSVGWYNPDVHTPGSPVDQTPAGAAGSDHTPDGGYIHSWVDRVIVSALAVLVGAGLIGTFGIIANLAGNELPLSLSVWVSAWGIGMLAALVVCIAFVWSIYDITKQEKMRRQKYGQDQWFRNWVDELKP